MRRVFQAAGLLILFPLSACATMFSSEKQDVKLRAYPPDAVVSVDGLQTVNTSAVVPLSRADPHYIDVSREGFESKRVAVKQELNPWFFANFLFGPAFWVGMIVDGVTGRIHELAPVDITVSLDPKAAHGGPPAPESPAAHSASAAATSPRTAASVPGATPSGGTDTSRSQDAARTKVPRTLISPAQQGWVIAVMIAGTSGKSPFGKNTLLALTDQIRVFLAERGARVVDRTAQEAALKSLVDEEKKRSYASCVDSSCQIPLGKALAASHILRSTVATFGKACATNGELIDLRAEVTVAAGSARSECNEEALLYSAEVLAEQLIVGSIPKAKP